MRKTAKKAVSLLLSVLMAFTLIGSAGFGALAAEPCDHLYGTTGEARYTCVRCGETDEALFDAVFCPPDPAGRVSHWYENFETDPVAKGWIFTDLDGDGHNWRWHMSGVNGAQMNRHSGFGVMTSESFDADASEVLYPDNWAISPAVSVAEGDDLSFWAVGQDDYDSHEVFRVYIGESAAPAEMEPLTEDLVTTDEYRNVILDLSDWAGKTVHIAFRHYHVSDQYMLNIDDVDIGVSAPREEHVFGEEGDDRFVCQSCGWVNETLKSDATFCGNYDLHTDFETSPWDAGWTWSDEDGDGNNWEWYGDDFVTGDHSGEGFLWSASWTYNTDALRPDNYAYSPRFTVSEGAELSYLVIAQNPNWPGDALSVYLETEGTVTELGEKKTATATMTKYVEDLSDYAGKTARVIFRHYDSSDIFGILIDDVIVTPGVFDAHDYEIAWNWANDFSACVASMTCANCGRTHVFAADLVYAADMDLYVASFIYDGVTYEDVREAPPHEHSYGGPDWTWNPDGSGATAAFLCEDVGCPAPENSRVTVTAHVSLFEHTAPGCLTDGSDTYVATAVFMGETYHDSFVVIFPAFGEHEPGEPETENETDAACEAAGYYEAVVYCLICGEELSRETVITDPATGHSFTNYVYNNDASCTENGTETAACDNGCGKTDEREAAGSATGHSFTDYVYNNDATCTENGTETAACDNGCGETDEREAAGSATGHSFTNYAYNNDATCTENGTETAACDNGCGETDEREAAGTATGHAYGEPEWTWSADHRTATATFRCEKGDDTKTVTQNATQVEVSPAAANADQVVKYTVTVRFNGNTYTAETGNITVPGTATGEPEHPDTPSHSDACKWCGETHTGFWGSIVGFFHSILYFFAHLFGLR